MINNNLPFGFDENGNFRDEEMSNIEKILHSRKLNYKDLKKISDPLFNDNKCETVNLFIDVFDIFKPLYSPNIIDDFSTLRVRGRIMIIIEMINIIAHYRHFFASRYKKYTTVIFYYSTKKDLYLKSLNNDYKKNFYNKRIEGENPEYNVINKVFQDCINVIREYCYYIPHAYFIDSMGMEPRLVPYAILKEEVDLKGRIFKEDFNIIMSNDDLSLLNMINLENCVVFRNNGKKESKYITKDDIIKEICGVDDNQMPLKPLVNLLYGISGYKKNDIKNIKGYSYKKAYKRINKEFLKEKNLYKCHTIEEIKNLFEDLDAELIYNNIKQINFSMYPYTESKLNCISNQIIDTPDRDYLYKVNLDYFNGRYCECYILYDYLFDGEEE